MKKLLIVPVLALVALVAYPDQSHALSCMDPESMVEQYVENPEYVIVTATPNENKEHIKEKADDADPNRTYNSGYTAQLLAIKKVHKGSSPDIRWAYFERNGTWNYLCAGEPATIGKEYLYILHEGTSVFDVTGVAGVYPLESKVAKDTLAALEKNTEEVGEPTIYEADREYFLQQLHDQLKDMAFIIKVKLTEWNFWKGAK